MEMLKWYLRGIRFVPRLFMATVRGDRFKLAEVEAEISAYHRDRPGK